MLPCSFLPLFYLIVQCNKECFCNLMLVKIDKKELRLRLWNMTVQSNLYKKLFQSENHLR